MKDGKERVTRSEAARRLGMTPQALGVYAAKPTAPMVTVKGKSFCLWPDFPRWYRDHLQRDRPVAAPPAALAESELRQEAAKAQLLELDLAERQGKLMTVEQYTRVVGEAFERVVAQAKAMKKKLAPEVLAAKTPAEAEVIIDDHVRAMLSELWEGADVPEADADHPAERAA